jgi:hypothetical protein
MQREKEGGSFHHNVENNGLCALKVQPIMKLCVG